MKADPVGSWNAGCLFASQWLKADCNKMKKKTIFDSLGQYEIVVMKRSQCWMVPGQAIFNR